MTSFICGLTRLADSGSSDDTRVPRLLFMANGFQFGFNRHGGAPVKLLSRLRYKLLIFLATIKSLTTVLNEMVEAEAARFLVLHLDLFGLVVMDIHQGSTEEK